MYQNCHSGYNVINDPKYASEVLCLERRMLKGNCRIEEERNLVHASIFTDVKMPMVMEFLRKHREGE